VTRAQRRAALLLLLLLPTVTARAEPDAEPSGPQGASIAVDRPSGPAASVSTPSLSHVDAAPAGPSAAERLEQIRIRVQQAVVFPPIARKRGVSGEAEVGFRVAADGAPHEIALEKSSGSRTLDAAAERAVGAAAPLPGIAGRVVVPVRFSLQPDTSFD